MANLSNINNKFIVEDSGDVGIGVTAATSKLHLRDPGSNSDVGIKIGNDSRDWNLKVMGSVSDSLQFFTHDNSNVMTILPSGNVGIGETSPDYRLAVAKTSQAAPAFMVSGAYYGGPRIQTYGLDADPNAWMGLGTDMAGLPYEHSIYFSNKASTGQGVLTIGSYDGTTYSTKMTVWNNGNVGIGTGTTSPAARLDILGPSSTPVIMKLTTENTNCDITMASYFSTSATRLRTSGSDFQVHTNGTESMRITSSGKVVVQGENFVIDDVREHREEFVLNGNSAYNFDVDIKSIGASGQPFEVFVAFTHYSTGYGAAYHAAYYQRSTVQSDITLIHQYFNQNSTRGGTWTVTWLSATQIRISKSAGVGGSTGYGYLRVTQVDF